MSKNQAFIPVHLKPWIDARRRWNLSHAHIQMARELGMNPKNFGKLANHRQERWKRPLPEFITHLYVKRFGRMPSVTRTIEEIAAAEMAKRRARKIVAQQDLERSVDDRHHDQAEAEGHGEQDGGDM